VEAEILVVRGEAEFLEAIAMQRPDVILLDNGVPGFSGTAALNAARNLIPGVPVIIASGSVDERKIGERLKSGAYDSASKDQLVQLSVLSCMARQFQCESRSRSQTFALNCQ